MKYFTVEEDSSPLYTGVITGSHKWGLPGVDTCPACGATWGDNSRAYPSVDLTSVASLAEFADPWAVPIEEYERMCELVRPCKRLKLDGVVFKPVPISRPKKRASSGK